MSWGQSTTLLGLALAMTCCTSSPPQTEGVDNSPSATAHSPTSLLSTATPMTAAANVTTARSEPTRGSVASTVTDTILDPTTSVLRPTRTPSTPYRVPVADVDHARWGDSHSGYPATDIFVGCGAELVAPVDGTLLEVQRVNTWDAAIDNPATRGGRSIAILADDGVRYYLAHFDAIVEPLELGDRVSAGQPLGTMGMTGRASACHVHFAISPPCPGKEWSVRRGVIWPYPYLNAWRSDEQLSPVDEVAAWVAANPDACAAAMVDPNAAANTEMSGLRTGSVLSRGNSHPRLDGRENGSPGVDRLGRVQEQVLPEAGTDPLRQAGCEKLDLIGSVDAAGSEVCVER